MALVCCTPGNADKKVTITIRKAAALKRYDVVKVGAAWCDSMMLFNQLVSLRGAIV